MLSVFFYEWFRKSVMGEKFLLKTLDNLWGIVSHAIRKKMAVFRRFNLTLRGTIFHIRWQGTFAGKWIQVRIKFDNEFR